VSIYTVLGPPGEAGDVAADPLSLVFVKEGFCWPALFIPEIWLIFRRMWLWLLVDVAAIVAASLASGPFGVAAVLIFALARLLFALEANGLRRWRFYRHGYRLIDVVEGRRLREAELRFFLEWAPEMSALPPPPEPEPRAAKPPSPEAGEVVGLFPVPGGAA
jgi:hypothetical protein